MTTTPIRIFIGSADRSILEQLVLQWSIVNKTRKTVEFYIMNGTHNKIMGADGDAVEGFLDPALFRQNLSTPFTFFRYGIPQFCNYEGRAIYLDADQLLLCDIDELWQMPLDQNDALMCQAYRNGKWATSVMLFDCSRFRLDLGEILTEVEEGLYSLEDLNYLTEQFRQKHPFQIGVLAPAWNSFDWYDANTKLIHFTNLRMQPWRYTINPNEDLWMAHLQGAYKDNYVDKEILRKAIDEEGYRQDLVELAESGLQLSAREKLERRMKAIMANAKFMTPKQYLYNLYVGIQRI